MYKSIFSLSFLLVCLAGFTTPGQAQIELSSNGNAGIGTSPSSNNQLRVITSNDGMAIYGRSSYGGNAYGLRGEAHGGWYNYGIYGKSTNTSAFSNRGVYGNASGGYDTNYGVYGSASGGYSSYGGYFTGGVYVSGGITYGSDERLKTNIRELRDERLTSKIRQLRPLRYEFLSAEALRNQGLPASYTQEGEHFGLLAQELEKVFPELVSDVVHVLEEDVDPEQRGDGEPETVTTKAINYQELTVLLLAAVQELQQKVEELEKTLRDN